MRMRSPPAELFVRYLRRDLSLAPDKDEEYSVALWGESGLFFCFCECRAVFVDMCSCVDRTRFAIDAQMACHIDFWELAPDHHHHHHHHRPRRVFVPSRSAVIIEQVCLTPSC